MSKSNEKTVEIEIHYCTACNWLLRSGWMAQEILSTFSAEVSKVSLVPSAEAGQFKITVNKTEIWERKKDGGFPDVKQFKQLVRDRVSPEKNLGHLEDSEISPKS